MISRMKKVLLIGAESSKEDVIRNIQKAGVLHIEPYKGSMLIRQTDRSDISSAESVLSLYKLVSRITEEFPDVKPVKSDFSSVGEAVSILVGLESSLAEAEENIQILKNEKDDISVWGRFSIKDIRDIEIRTGTSVQFWEVPAKYLDKVDLSSAVCAIEIRRESLRHYFITFSNEKIHLENCLEEKIERDILSLEAEISELSGKIADYRAGIAYFAGYKNELYKAYLSALDKYNFDRACYSSVEAVGDVFAYQGWVPEKDFSRLEKYISDLPASITMIEPEEGETAPTEIKNKKFSAVGQELVEFYDTPSYRDWDPSAFVFFSFIIFFAMIMGDAGYGFILFLVTLFAALKVKKPGVKAKRMLSMAFILSGATIAYGFITGSYFGTADDNPVFGFLSGMRLFSAGGTDKKTLDTMMSASVIIGMVHISLSLFLKALRLIFSEKSFFASIANFAWITAIWTFFFFYGNSFAGIESGQEIQKYVLYGCAAVIFITSAGSLNPLKMIPGGLLGWYNGVQFFSDVLSYLRIFALGLSGALIAQTFNSISASMSDAGGIFIVLAVFVSIMGHLLNLGLSIMSAVIHGLRLNYLEYYRWSFDGGGKAYSPLKSLLEQ